MAGSNPDITINVLADTTKATTSLRNVAKATGTVATAAAKSSTDIGAFGGKARLAAEAATKVALSTGKAATSTTKLGDAAKKGGDGAKKLANDTETARKSTASLGTSMDGLVKKLAQVAVAYGALRVASSAVRNLVGENMRYEDTMAAVKAVTEQAPGFTEVAFGKMQAEARRLGATTRFSASEAADGLKFLGMAGFTAEQATASLESTLKLAQAGALGMGESADIVSNILTAFGASAERTEEFANALAVTAARSNTDVRQLGEAMKYVGPIAGGLGRSVQETSAAMGVLGSAGIQASMAGTSLRGVLIALADSNSKAYRALVSMGVATKDLDVRSRSLEQIFTSMADAGVNSANAYSLFGARAGVAADVLTANIGAFRKMNDVVADSDGALDQMAKTMDNTLVGAVFRVKSAWAEMNLQIGDGGLGAVLAEVVDGVEQMMNAFTESGTAAKWGVKLKTTFAALGGTIAAIAPHISTLIDTIGGILRPLTAIGVAFVALRVASLVSTSGIATNFVTAALAAKNFAMSVAAGGLSFRALGASGMAAITSLKVAFTTAAGTMKLAMMASLGAITIALVVLGDLFMRRMSEAHKLMASVEETSGRINQREDFENEINSLAENASSNEDVTAIREKLQERLKTLERVGQSIASNSELTEEMISDQLAQHNLEVKSIERMLAEAETGKPIVRKIQVQDPKTGEVQTEEKVLQSQNFQARLLEQAKLNALAKEELATKERISEAEAEAQAASGERVDDMQELLEKWEAANKIRNIEDSVKGTARIKAFLELQGFENEDEMRARIAELRLKLEGKGGIVTEEDAKQLESILGLADRLREIRAEQTKRMEDKNKSREEYDLQMQILDAKLAGDEKQLAALERRAAIEQKTAELRAAGFADADAMAQRMVDKEAALKKKEGDSKDEKKMTVLAGANQGALNRILGRSTNEFIAKETEAARKVAEKAVEVAKKSQETLTIIADKIKPGGVGTFA